MTIDYKKLITNSRRQKTSAPKHSIAEESESDRGRVIYSSSFRRLQKKAQVFSLEDNASVRSRLTHSLEVGQVGRYLARTTLKKLGSCGNVCLSSEEEQAFVNLVETACLIHDIGNPPFGHFGESAIQSWFKRNGKDCIEKALGNIKNIEVKLEDFIQFDGNCQGFRLLTRLLWNRDEFGLNLTCSQLATFLKYVRSPNDLEDGHFSKKPGYFSTEQFIVDEIWSSLGMKKKERFPLVYLMEAADDLAYCLSDIEDGIEKSIISENYFYEKIKNEWEHWNNELEISDDWFTDLLDNAWIDNSENVELSCFLAFKTRFTTALVEAAASQYVKDHHILLSRGACSLLENNTKEHVALKSLKSFSRRYLYRSNAAEDIELAGYQIISGLFDHYRPLMTCNATAFMRICGLDDQSKRFGFNMSHEIPDGCDLEVRLFNKLPRKYRRCYYKSVKENGGIDNICKDTEWLYRSHLIVDYIAGMTDHYALETFQLSSGIKVA